ncbi:MAG TPA: formylglycine-generating enzyme family protein, partial [Planctomycetota bacterium]|nr:formylglycine-generating enzyme family protein [Planctomycetota bacterium]
PLHRVKLDGFWLDCTEVTNAQFAAFVVATAYVTDAEQQPTAEELPGVPAEQRVPGALVFKQPGGQVDRKEFRQWWQFVPGADWRHPLGPDSKVAQRDDHPVVQVSWRDAQAYCKWAHKRLPSEAEWEYAARGGLDQKRYVWGDEQVPGGKWQANIWQGDFPTRNELGDGYATTAPVRAFAANGFGLFGMSGNVWEWCEDFYRADAYGDGKQCCINPRGPKDGVDAADPDLQQRVMRGGSYLCSDVYCLGYQPGTRMKSSPDTSLCHAGFRCALTAPAPAAK